MRTRRSAVAMAMATLVLCLGCRGLVGSGTAQSEVRPAGSFHVVTVSGAVRLEVDIGDAATQVAVSGDDNLLKHVTTTFVDGVLHIATDGNVAPQLPLTVHVATPLLDRLEVSGAADVRIRKLRGPAFTAEFSGAASVDLQGEVSAVVMRVSGVAEVKASELKAHSVRVDLSGAGHVTVWADEFLFADVSGAGAVEYAGQPARIEKAISGLGEVRPTAR